MNGIFIIAHAPLASAFRQCVLHVFPENGVGVAALDVQPNMPPEETLAQARIMLAQIGTPQTLVLTDIFGAVSYRQEPLDALVARALAGATQGVMQVAVTAPQNQAQRKHDQDSHEHQQ